MAVPQLRAPRIQKPRLSHEAWNKVGAGGGARRPERGGSVVAHHQAAAAAKVQPRAAPNRSQGNTAITSESETEQNGLQGAITSVTGVVKGMAAVGVGGVTGLLTSIVWQQVLARIVGKARPHLWSAYETDSAEGRAVQKQLWTAWHRIVGAPLQEELLTRGIPVALGLIVRGNQEWIVIGMWGVLNGTWVAGHIWQSVTIRRRKCVVKLALIPYAYWSSCASAGLHAVNLWGQAMGYTATWLAGPVILRAAGIKAWEEWGLVSGGTAASAMHSLHNLLVVQDTAAGRLYRKLRNGQR